MGEENSLIGRWVSDPQDRRCIEEYGDVSIEFSSDGKLTYIIHQPEKDSILRLTYRVQGNILVTDQPSKPGEEETRFSISADGRLFLFREGLTSTYVRP